MANSTTRSVGFQFSDPNYERVQTEIEVGTIELTTRRPSLRRSATSFLRRRSSVLSSAENHHLPSNLAVDEYETLDGLDADGSDNDENDHDKAKITSPEIDGGGVAPGEYVSVLVRHPGYRAYLGSHLCQNLGDDFVRIANVLVVQDLATKRYGVDGAAAALAHITLARLLPNALLALVGGVLADKFDRRKLMISIDTTVGTIVLGYLLAIRWESLSMLYLVTVLRSAMTAVYYPSATGILPDLVHEETNDKENEIDKNNKNNNQTSRNLQLAVTLNTWAWGGSRIFGGLLAGKIASILGMEACYFIDCATYWLSAVLMAKGVRADYNSHRKNEAIEANNGFGETKDLEDNNSTRDDNGDVAGYSSVSSSSSLFAYLAACGFGWMVLAKPSGSLIWGIEDVVGAEFATVFGADGAEDEVLSSVHVGLLFTVIGLGNSIGPVLFNHFTDARKPYTLQRACWIGLVLLMVGWLAISCSGTFWEFLWGTLLRTTGTGAVWVYSSVVLQTLCDHNFLGRVLALEFTLTTLFEAASCFLAGNLGTMKGLSENQLALVGAGLGLAMVVVWGVYYSLSLGAAHPRFNASEGKDSYEAVLPMDTTTDRESTEPKEIEMGNRDASNNNLVHIHG